jgi:hypothetical protein
LQVKCTITHMRSLLPQIPLPGAYVIGVAVKILLQRTLGIQFILKDLRWST